MSQKTLTVALYQPRGLGWECWLEGGWKWREYVYLCLIHVGVWGKTKFCEAIILQLKKKKKIKLSSEDANIVTKYGQSIWSDDLFIFVAHFLLPQMNILHRWQKLHGYKGPFTLTVTRGIFLLLLLFFKTPNKFLKFLFSCNHFVYTFIASFLFQYYNVKISHNIKCCFKWFNSSLIMSLTIYLSFYFYPL